MVQPREAQHGFPNSGGEAHGRATSLALSWVDVPYCYKIPAQMGAVS